jgi:hypothetical protein
MTAFSGSGRLADLARVLRMTTLVRDGAELSLTLELEEAKGITELQFLNVSGLKFRGHETELSRQVLLMAEDISSLKWDSANFIVKDYEDRFISFRCNRIRRL